MTLDQYLKLLDWTGRQLSRDQAGRIPAEFDPVSRTPSARHEPRSAWSMLRLASNGAVPHSFQTYQYHQL